MGAIVTAINPSEVVLEQPRYETRKPVSDISCTFCLRLIKLRNLYPSGFPSPRHSDFFPPLPSLGLSFEIYSLSKINSFTFPLFLLPVSKDCFN